MNVETANIIILFNRKNFSAKNLQKSIGITTIMLIGPPVIPPTRQDP